MFLYPSLITALSMLLLLAVSIAVGAARGRYKVSAPATSGHPDFERYFRVQQNTVEQMVFFLPSLWLFAAYVSPEWAAGLGAVWLVGRVLFALGYYREAKKRQLGFIIGFFSGAILLVGALIGIVMQLAA